MPIKNDRGATTPRSILEKKLYSLLEVVLDGELVFSAETGLVSVDSDFSVSEGFEDVEERPAPEGERWSVE
jgi:hypothetical protein